MFYTNFWEEEKYDGTRFIVFIEKSVNKSYQQENKKKELANNKHFL